MSSLSTLPKGDSAWLLRKSIQRIMQQVSVLETNIGSSTTGNSADTQVIFNDAGTLRGDTGLTYDKSADRLSFGAGICYGLLTSASATITGDLTVDTSTLKVDSANNRVGINTATPVAGIALHVCDNVFGANLSSGVRFGNSGNNYYFDQLIVTDGSANPSYQLKFTNQTLSRYLFGGGANYWEWYANNTLGMTLNTTGLGVGVVPITQARLSLKTSAASPLNLVLQNRDASQNWQFYVDGVVVGDGILTINNGTSSVMQMTPTGNVGIGVTPSAWGIYKGLQVGYASLAGYAGSDTFLGSNVYFDGGAFKYIAAGLASSYRQLAGGHQWSTAVAGANPGDPLTLLPQMTLDASGNLSLANGNLVMGTSGKGIDFSATASGSGTMTSELLNDYEEGTFTATLKGATTDPTTPVTTTGRYTKIGREVTVQVFFVNKDTTGASGRIQIAGLPFANNSSIEAVGLAAFYDMATFTGSPFAQFGQSATQIEVYSSVSSSAYQPVTHNAGTNKYMWINLTYTV